MLVWLELGLSKMLGNGACGQLAAAIVLRVRKRLTKGFDRFEPGAGFIQTKIDIGKLLGSAL
ncbi:MAG: hypothetical protein RMJ19_10355 [Gemmatales bacterium]|nr:hypothetical protein [Gemmatales bacterium]MCS7160860.1 hypothetical protein [Gemmatales bacterium]MDW8176062.1 hypothetical protein [Gemmatales bacterium]